jgi:GAF domain-containing protein
MSSAQRRYRGWLLLASAAEEILLPVRSAGRPVGGFVLTTATSVRRPSPEKLRVAVLLADQVGFAVAHAHRPIAP